MKKRSILLLIILLLSGFLFSVFSNGGDESNDSQRQPWSLIK